MFDTNGNHWFLIEFKCIDAEMLSDFSELLSISVFLLFSYFLISLRSSVNNS